MHTNTTAEVNDSKIKGQLQAIFYLLQSKIDEIKDEVDKSYELLTKIGKKTTLSQVLEQSITDPLNFLSNSASSIDESIKSAIEKFIVDFFKFKKEFISEVFVATEKGNHLSFLIVLKKDDEANRNSMFEVLDVYEKTELSEKYPITFHFIPQDMNIKGDNIKEISL